MTRLIYFGCIQKVQGDYIESSGRLYRKLREIIQKVEGAYTES